MAKAVEAGTFERMNWGRGITSGNTSVDVSTILRNLKLRRESCNSLAASGPAISDYDTTLPRSHKSVPPEFGSSAVSMASPFGTEPAMVSGGTNVAGISWTGSDVTDAMVMNGPPRQHSLYVNLTSPSARVAVDLRSDGRISPGGTGPAFIKPGASTASSFPIAAHDEARFAGLLAAPPVDATAEVTMLMPSTSTPSSAHLATALSNSSGKSPAAPIPLKAASSMALLADHAASKFRLPLSAASSQCAIGSPPGSGAATTLFSTARQLSGEECGDAFALDGKGSLGDGLHGSSGGGLGGCSGSSGGCSRSASPSLRLGGVAATAFAAASAIVAATSAAAAAGGRSAAAVAAAAAEVARDIADSVTGRRSPPRPPQSPKPLPSAGLLTTSVSSPSRSGTQSDYKADVDGGHGGGVVYGTNLAKQRRSSLELQIARLKGVLEGRTSSPKTVANGHPSNGSADGPNNGAAAAVASSAASVATAINHVTAATEAAAAASRSANLGSSYQTSSSENQPQTPVHPTQASSLSGFVIADSSSGGGSGGSVGGVGVGASRPLSSGCCLKGVLLPAPTASMPLPSPYSGAAATCPSVVPSATASVAAAASSPSTTNQRSQLLEELHSTHKRELALAEQLGRARAEVLELSAQLSRQTEAAVAATAAAAAEAATAAELRGQLRAERAEADEQVRWWRSRATAAEEQLQTALTQLACLRSAAVAAAAAAEQWGTAQVRHSAGGGGPAAAADPYGRTVQSFGGTATSPQRSRPLSRGPPPKVAAAAVADVTSGDVMEETESAPLSQPPTSQGPSSPLQQSPTPSEGYVDGTLPLRRSLSYQTLWLETGLGEPSSATPPRAVSTPGGAKEEGDAYALVDGAAAAAGSGSSGGGAPPGSPPILTSAAATVAAAASFSSGDVGGVHLLPSPSSEAQLTRPMCPSVVQQIPVTSAAAYGTSTSTSVTISYGASDERSPSYGVRLGHGSRGCRGGGGGGAMREVAGDTDHSKGPRLTTDDSYISGGTTSIGEPASGLSPWATGATAATPTTTSGETARFHMSHSVPNTTSFDADVGVDVDPLPAGDVPAKILESSESEGMARLESLTSAVEPPCAVRGGGNGGGSKAAAAPPPPSGEDNPLEADDGTAVLQSSGAPPPARIRGYAVMTSVKGEAAAAALLVAEVERLKQAGNRAYRSDQYPLARHCYTCALELLLSPSIGRPVVGGGGGAATPATVAVGSVRSDGGGAECAAAEAVAAARERAVAVGEDGGSCISSRRRVPGEQRMVSALYCSRAAAHVAMRLYADAVADCCAASTHDEAYAKPWKCRAEALASINAFGPAAAALERCIQLTAVAAVAAASTNNPKTSIGATSVTIGGAAGGGVGDGGAATQLVEYNDVDPRELPLLRHILHRLQELARAAAAPAPPAAAALLAAVAGAPSNSVPPVDHYAVLGIPCHASAVDVRAAYRRLALRYHPDKTAAAAVATPVRAAVVAAASTVFPMVAEAYAVLSDNAGRRAYDLRRARVALSKRHCAS